MKFLNLKLVDHIVVVTTVFLVACVTLYYLQNLYRQLNTAIGVHGTGSARIRILGCSGDKVAN
jgi:hypothetical protein